jgi:hypothetical protein
VALDHGRDQAVAVPGVGHVAGDGAHARQLFLQLREPLGPPRGEHRDGAGAGQRPRELLPQSGARARTMTL